MPPPVPPAVDDDPRPSVADLVVAAALAAKNLSIREAAARTGGKVSHSRPRAG
jgi:hypothetical protein